MKNNSQKNLRWRLAQWLELRWWKRYLGKQERENYLEWKKEYWRSFLADLGLNKDELLEKRILDLGCGPAGLAIFEELKIESVDSLALQYEKRGLKMHRQGILNATIENFSSHENFDFVFCVNAINHVDDLAAALRNLRKLSSGAKLVISTDLHLFKPIKRLFSLLQWDVLHPQQITKNEFINLLNKCEFSIQKEKVLKSGWVFCYTVFIAE